MGQWWPATGGEDPAQQGPLEQEQASELSRGWISGGVGARLHCLRLDGSMGMWVAAYDDEGERLVGGLQQAVHVSDHVVHQLLHEGGVGLVATARDRGRGGGGKEGGREGGSGGGREGGREGGRKWASERGRERGGRGEARRKGNRQVRDARGPCLYRISSTSTHPEVGLKSKKLP